MVNAESQTITRPADRHHIAMNCLHLLNGGRRNNRLIAEAPRMHQHHRKMGQIGDIGRTDPDG